ncbi:MAG: hypothetical protein H3C47_06090 [Candidatus Cloacimonetes bacterium]|nr:hypothetical protein [Candidatus Cloacimonadota bacterium]
MRTILSGITFCLLSLVMAIHADAIKDAHKTQIIFQGFGWDSEIKGPGNWYTHLASMSKNLAKAGVTHVWFPPVSRSVSPQGYMPGDYYDLGDDSSPTYYGTLNQLQKAIQDFANAGIVSVADIVINHRTASHQEDGLWNVFHHNSGRMRWEKWALAAGDYGGTGSPDSGGDFEPAPDIDHTNHRVRADIIEWLRWMRDAIGFEGFRFDYTKGFDGAFVKEYVKAVPTSFCVGEYWTSMNYNGTQLLPDQNKHRQEITDWVDRTEGTCSTFDFTTKGILQEAVRTGEYWRLKDSQGKASGLLGWWPTHAVSFVDNHDTGSKQAHWEFPKDRVLAGYAYILTHPGTPSVFYEHFVDWDDRVRDGIAVLMGLRHKAGIHSGSSLEILKAEQDLYVGVVDSRVLLKLGRGQFQPENGWSILLEGLDFSVYSR